MNCNFNAALQSGCVDSKQPFGIKDKIGYMFGDFGNDFIFIFARSFLMVFYTNVLGIDLKMVGVLFVVARVVDAFTDIGMGRIVDRLPASKDGKFRSWLKRICLPVAFMRNLAVTIRFPKTDSFLFL